jgi:hypothetical protein
VPPPVAEAPFLFPKQRGRHALTDDEVIWLRRHGHLYGEKMLLKAFEVSPNALRGARKGLTFKHLNHIAKPQR